MARMKRHWQVEAMFFVGWLIFGAAPMAQSASYSITPTGPRGSESLGSDTVFRQRGVAQDHLFYYWGSLFSPDGGESWRSLTNALPGSVRWMLEDRNSPQVLYLSYYPGPFVRSTDGGSTFQVVSLPFGTDISGWGITQDAAGTLYLMASPSNSNFHLYSSNDGGVSWSRVAVSKGLNRLQKGFHFFFADAATPRLVYACFAQGTTGVFLASKDGGQNWAERMAGLPNFGNGHLFRSLAQSRVAPYTLYGVLENSNDNPNSRGLAFTNNHGATWHVVKKPPGHAYAEYDTLCVKPGTNGVLYDLGYAKGLTPPYTTYSQKRLLVSNNGGRTWTARDSTIVPSEGWTAAQLCDWSCPTPPMGSYYYFCNLAVTKAGNLVLGTDPMGFLLSSDDGNTFEVHNSWAQGRQIGQLLKASDGMIHAGGSIDSQMLWGTPDQGATWSYEGFGPEWSPKEAPDGAIWGLDRAGGLWRYSDGQMVLVSTMPPASNGALEIVQEAARVRLVMAGCWATGSPVFYSSDDLGTTWATLGTIQALTGLTALSADPRNPGALVTAGWNVNQSCGPPDSPYDSMIGGIYCSSDGGMTWSAAMDGNSIGGVTCLYRDKDNPDLMVASAMGHAQPGYGGLGGVFVSQDGGATWTRRSDGLPSFAATGSGPLISAVVSPPLGQTLFAAVQLNGGFYRSDDLGVTWTRIADLPVRLSDNFIQNYLCDFTIKNYAVTQILPLNDGTDSFLAATMGQGIFLATPQGAKAPAAPVAK